MENKDSSKKKKRRFLYEIYRNTPQEIPICEGISIDESMYDKKENRIFTLFLKGVMVYLLTMGSLGAYLSSIGCEYNAVVVNIVAFTTAIICSMLYYSYLVENLGYLVFFIIFAFVIYVLQKYISSGFNAILNDTYERVSSYFDSEGVQQYAEQYENRYLTITICASIISVIYNILLNNYISRSVRYIAAAVIVLFFNMVPIYMELEPDFIYLIMLVAGFLICYLIRSG
ncbi:MAG: hypothetical protein K6F77_07915, partial [Lachnospiraceae bacterium]|nr:hypothetical protein [Lachnospiraceae bacterium]